MKDFKVKCTFNGGFFKEGKEFPVIENVIKDSMGGCWSAESVGSLNGFFASKFELVEENEMKYKVGDKVEIINTGKIYSTYEGWFDCNCPNYKEQYVLFKSPKNGDVGKVVAMHMHKRLSDGMLCAIKIDDSIYLIGIDGIKYLGKSEFSKSDLKTGMFVTVRNGGGYRLLLGTENGDYGLNQVNGHYIKLKCYNDDLTDKNSREWDIVKVESVKYPENIKTKTPWERKESPIEITIEEIAKKFNVSPDLTRIKE